MDLPEKGESGLKAAVCAVRHLENDPRSNAGSGGIFTAALGRVGDVPLPGCGLYCGPAGVIACTGYGKQIALKILARDVYGWLERGLNPADAELKARGLFHTTGDDVAWGI
jgi:isoaspartyl peptidase/L-asparaginase-like protein (Ntn-hydrolase superfamily)